MMTDILFNSLFDTCADCCRAPSSSTATTELLLQEQPATTTTGAAALDIFIPEWCPQFGTAACCGSQAVTYYDY